jgi:lysine-specific demethylase 8
MEILDNIPRISAPAADVFLRDHVLACRPVILTDLFDGQPIRALDTADALRAHVPDLPIAVQPNYMSTAAGVDAATERTTLARFLDFIDATPGTPNLCIEYPTPPELAALIEPTEHCRVIDAHDLISLIFFAAPGNYVHLHVDGDQRHTLMYQAFGRKRYTIIDTRDMAKILPQEDRNSAIFLEHLSDADKLALLRYANAWDCVLEPGETLLIPMLAWHYVEYLDVSMSISYRLGRNRYNRFLAESVPAASPFLQRVARAFVDESAVDRERAELFARLEAVSAREYASRQERAQALDRCCMEICDTLDPAAAARPYTTFDRRLRAAHERAATAAPALAPPPDAPSWTDEDRVALRPGVIVLTSLADEAAGDRAVLLARYGRLELRMAIDERRPWLLELMRLLSRPEADYSVRELAASCGTGTAELRGVLAQLHGRGWVISGAASADPVTA